MLDRLADYAESRQEMNQKVAQATIYPAVLTTVSLLVVIGLLTWVVPQIVEVFDQTGQKLPFLTIMMIAISDFLKDYFILLIIGIAGIIFGIKKP